jgi:predicted GIY-YIG superfamily endonuclease
MEYDTENEKKHIIPLDNKPYYVYLLHSTVKKHKEKVYIGCTFDTESRLKKHNGEYRGGAKYTVNYRPWIFGAIYGPFEHQIALKAEWALQHPAESKYFKKKRRYEGPLSEITNDALMRPKDDAFARTFTKRKKLADWLTQIYFPYAKNILGNGPENPIVL